MTAPISIAQDPNAPVPAEVIATSIEQIAAAMRQINSTRLTRKALVALIHDQSKLPKRDIELVLTNLEGLERDWLKPKPQKG
jgi:hypothetical protein